MRGFTWSILGSVLSILILSSYVSLFNYTLSIYVEAATRQRAEQDEADRTRLALQRQAELNNQKLEEMIQKNYEREAPPMLEALGMIVP